MHVAPLSFAPHHMLIDGFAVHAASLNYRDLIIPKVIAVCSLKWLASDVFAE